MTNKITEQRFTYHSLLARPTRYFFHYKWLTAKHLQLFIASLLLLSANVSYALPEDRNQPIDVDANSATFDEQTGITTLHGSVKIVQGSMTITAAKLSIHKNAAGDISKMIATGSPAFFTQQQVKGQSHSKAWGSKMLYSVVEQTITITGNAKLEQLNDKISSEKIVYLMDKAVVKASGGKHRVKMILQPKAKK